MTDADPDLHELRQQVADLEEAIDELRCYGEEHDIPAIERSAMRLAGTVDTVKQNVPGGLTEN